MKHHIFAIYDAVAGNYFTPFFMSTQPEAKRAFNNLINDPGSTLSKTPEDFSLSELGTYDTETGQIEPISTIQLIARGSKNG